MSTVPLPSLARQGCAAAAAGAARGGAAPVASASARVSSSRGSSSSSSSTGSSNSSSSSSSGGSRRRFAVGDVRGGDSPKASSGRVTLPVATAEQEHASSSLPSSVSSADESTASAHVVSRHTFTHAAVASLVLGAAQYSVVQPSLAEGVTEAAPAAAAAPASLEQPVTAAAAAPATAPKSDGYALYENAKENYSLRVPEDWVTSEGTVGTRKLVAFHPPSTLLANVSVLITMLGADFTSLGSFGTVDAFAEGLVNSQDRSYLRKPGQKAVLIDAKSANKTYYVEYTIQKPGEDKIHLYSAVAIYNNGIYNQLYTLTAQHLEDESDLYKSTIQEVVKSFKVAR